MQLPLLAEVCIRLVLGCLYLALPPSLEMWVVVLMSFACVMVAAACGGGQVVLVSATCVVVHAL